ncbi:MAG: HAMP domain-containing histidine kinase [Deltaproteobacteria bacterium]|nr:HAMP domain-containing histidine kinase [Deltaproteobacteria bacterium]
MGNPKRWAGAWRAVRERVYHIIFAFSLVALVALGAWWWVFMNRAITERYESELTRLRLQAEQYQILFGHSNMPPQPQLITRESGLILVPSEQQLPGALPLSPRWPQVSVAVDPERAKSIEDKHHRQMKMWIGEGGFLFLLLVGCVAMLYRLVSAEIRFRKAMDSFLNQVTHELKTPVAGIRSLLQSLTLGRVPTSQMPHLLNLGLSNIDRLEHLIENILVRNRLRTHRFTPQLGPVDLGTLARQVIDHRLQLGLVQQMPGLEIKSRAKALGDAESIRVIMENLLDNAEKYSRGGDAVRMRIREDGDAIVLTVEDRGVGIAPEHIHDIFKPYFRGHEPRDGMLHGSGLGLDICRRLTTAMGGTITAHSEGPDMGSRFELRLRKSP